MFWKKFWTVTVTLVAATYFGATTHTSTAHASSSLENTLTKRAYSDGNKKVEKLVNPNVSIGLQGQAAGKEVLRNVYIDFFPNAQKVKGHTPGSASREFDLIKTRDGKAFVYAPTASHANAYTVITKGHGHTFYYNGRKVVMKFAKNGEIVINWQSASGAKHHVVASNEFTLTYDGKAVGRDKNRVWNKGSNKGFYRDAQRYAGMPYRYNAKSPWFGEDCATYVEQLYIDVKHKEVGMTTSAIAYFGNAHLNGIHDIPGNHVYMVVRNPNNHALYHTDEWDPSQPRRLFRI